MRKQITLILVAASVLCLPAAVHGRTERETPKPRAAIVVDDFGNNMEGTEEMINLPFPITAAVMPFLPTTKQDAEAAHRAGHDVIVHLPMEPVRGKKSWLGPGAILCDLSDDEIRRRVRAAIDDVPHAVGVNNHMGSKATADERVMRIVLEVCRERGLFFLDSQTSYRSVVPRVAEELGVPCIKNHIFLDDLKNDDHIIRQIRLLERHLRDHDECIAIAHVGIGGKETARVLKRALTDDIEPVGISKLPSLWNSRIPASGTR